MKILIFSLPRTGSSYLANLFKYGLENPLSLSEPFNIGNMNKYSVPYVKNIIVSASRANNVVCKTHFPDFCRIKSFKVQNVFLKNNKWYILQILRQDVVESVISNIIKIYMENANKKSILPFEIQKDELKYKLLESIEHISQIKKYNKKYNIINEFVYYEDLVFDYKKDYKNLKLSNSFEIKLHENAIVKPKSANKSNIVLNYKEIKEFGINLLSTIESPELIIDKGLVRLK